MDGTEYITLKEAGEISGYSPDYIGQLIRRGKLTGKQVYANVAWVTTRDALYGYLEDKGKAKKSEEEPLVGSYPAPLVSLKEVPTEGKAETLSSPVGEVGIPELKKWEALMRLLSIGIIVIATLFLIFLFHILSTLLDDRLERRALEHASAPSEMHNL